MNTKQLHKHSLPLIVLGVGILLLSVIAFQRFAQPVSSDSVNSVAGILNSTILTVKPAKSNDPGLFQISLNKPSNETSTAAQPKPRLIKHSTTVQAADVAKQVQFRISNDQ